jgi:hypothetical protein
MIKLNAALACAMLSLGSAAPAHSQRIPQASGWSYSRSHGLGTQNRTVVGTRSDSRGLQVVIESGNVEQIQRPDGTTAYRILDPSQPFDSFSQSSYTEELNRLQGLSIFSLSDSGYSVFSY